MKVAKVRSLVSLAPALVGVLMAGGVARAGEE